MKGKKIITVLEEQDEFPHKPDEVSNYNESMYLNTFDLDQEIGGWFRLGNRVNEGYAEMTVCLYLPDGRVGFMYGRPEITTNMEMNAGGLEITVLEPFKSLNVSYDGKVCLLDQPKEMADPKSAFRNNPIIECTVNLSWDGISPMFGGKPTYEDGTEVVQDSSKSFAKAHYEQHGKMSGTFSVGKETVSNTHLTLPTKA